MATIEGRNASDWIKSAKERQAKGQFDETGANEARQAVNNREIPRAPGGVRGIYAFRPIKDKPAPKPAPKPAEPARQVASMTKAEDHTSPVRPPEPAKRPEPAKPTAPVRPRPTEATGTEKDWNKTREDLRTKGRTRSIIRRADEAGSSSLIRLQAEAREIATKETARRAKRDQDQWDSKNIVEKAGSVVRENIEKPIYRSLKKTAASVGPTILGYAKRAGRWIGGDPEARRRLAK
jgi:hypothetical protein